MNLVLLDQYFPNVVFFYGFLLVFMLEARWVEKAAKGPLAKHFLMTLRSRKGFGYTCFYVGGIWSVQNLLFS
jgi:hypothetical protein